MWSSLSYEGREYVQRPDAERRERIELPARKPIRPGDWVRVVVGAGESEAIQLGRVVELPEDDRGLYIVFLDDGPRLRVPGSALTLLPIFW